MTIAVVGRALVRIAQHLVGLAGLLELLFRRMIARIAVRMILERQLAIGALQLLVAGIARNAQHLVVICFAHSVFKPVHFSRLARFALIRLHPDLPDPLSVTRSFACLFGIGTTRTSAGRNSLSRSL